MQESAVDKLAVDQPILEEIWKERGRVEGGGTAGGERGDRKKAGLKEKGMTSKHDDRMVRKDADSDC